MWGKDFSKELASCLRMLDGVCAVGVGLKLSSVMPATAATCPTHRGILDNWGSSFFEDGAERCQLTGFYPLAFRLTNRSSRMPTARFFQVVLLVGLFYNRSGFAGPASA